MHPGRLLTVPPSMHCARGCLLWGVHGPRGCLVMGGCLVLGHVYYGGAAAGVVSQNALRQTHPLCTALFTHAFENITLPKIHLWVVIKFPFGWEKSNDVGQSACILILLEKPQRHTKIWKEFSKPGIALTNY